MTDTKSKRAMIWFESHLGAGDAKLSFNLAEGLARNGYEVYIASSSVQRWKNIFTPNTHIHTINLPELERGQDNIYRTPSNTKFPDDKDYVETRKSALLEAFANVSPDLLVTQAWPIGRDPFDEEMLALKNVALHAYKRPLLACYPCDSVFVNTDSNGRQKWRKAQFVDELRDFDTILIPGKELLDFATHLPAVEGFRDKIHYTGYMVQDFDTLPTKDKSEVIVCSGGGWHNTDMPFYEAAIKSRKYTELSDDVWRIKVSRRLCSDEKFDQIVAWARAEDPLGNKIIVEAADDKFQQQMVNSKMLLVRSGYNTLIEAVHAGKHVVTFPRPYKGADKEQQERALALQDAGYVRAITHNELETYVAEEKYPQVGRIINESLHERVGELPRLDTNGADNAAAYFDQKLEEHAAVMPSDDVTHAIGVRAKTQGHQLGVRGV